MTAVVCMVYGTFERVHLRKQPNETSLDRLEREMLVRQSSDNALLTFRRQPGAKQQKPSCYVFQLQEIDIIFAKLRKTLFKPGKPVCDPLPTSTLILRGPEELVKALTLTHRFLLPQVLQEFGHDVVNSGVVSPGLLFTWV